MAPWRTFPTGCGLALMVFNELAQGATVDMAEVSVCRDATFQIPISRGAVCSGYGAQPFGVQCPRVGDTALDACHPYIDSYNGVDCVAKEDAQCVHLEGRNVWGCAFPSTWCLDKWKAPEETARDSCLTWDFYSGESSLSVDPFDVENQDNGDPAWFTKTTKVTKLYNCKVDTPTLAPTQEQDTAIPTTPSEIPVYTMAPALTTTMVPQVETVVAAIVDVPQVVVSSPSEAPVQTVPVTMTPVVPVATDPPSLAPTAAPVPSLPPIYLDPTPTEILAVPTPTSYEELTIPPTTEIPTVTPCTDEVKTAAPTYETLSPSTEQTWVTPMETAAISTTTSPPMPTTTSPSFETTVWYPTPSVTKKAIIAPDTTEPTSTAEPPLATLPATELHQSTPDQVQELTEAPSVTETLAPSSPPPAETTFSPHDAKPESQTPQSTPYSYDTPCPTKSQTLTPIFTSSPAPFEEIETDAPTSNPPSSTNNSYTMEETPISTPCASPETPLATTEPPISTPTATLATPTEAVPYTTQLTTTEPPTTETPCSDQLTTEVPISETSTSEPPTIETLTTKIPSTKVPTTEAPTTEVPVATIQSQYQQEEQQNDQQPLDTTAPLATTQASTDPVNPTSLSVHPAETPCATTTANKQTALQASTESDLMTIASVSISAAAVIAIIIAVGTIVVVTIAIFRAQRHSIQPPIAAPDNRVFDHSIVLTPSDF